MYVCTEALTQLVAPRLAHQCDYTCVSQLAVERTGITRYADVDRVVSVSGNADPKGQWEHENGMTVPKKRKICFFIIFAELIRVCNKARKPQSYAKQFMKDAIHSENK